MEIFPYGNVLKISLNLFLHFIGKRVFLNHHRYFPIRTHDQTLAWAETVEEGTFASMMGITGKSVFFGASGFDIVRDILPEPMHLLDGGMMKALCSRIFKSNAGTNMRIPNYKKTSTKLLSNLIR
jgi:hypothetical protein